MRRTLIVSGVLAGLVWLTSPGWAADCTARLEDARAAVKQAEAAVRKA